MRGIIGPALAAAEGTVGIRAMRHDPIGGVGRCRFVVAAEEEEEEKKAGISFVN